MLSYKHGPCKEILQCNTQVEVTLLIYERLYRKLDNSLVESLYSGEKPVDCTKCVIERGCCKKKKFMMAMIRGIWNSIKSNDFGTFFELSKDICHPPHTLHLVYQ